MLLRIAFFISMCGGTLSLFGQLQKNVTLVGNLSYPMKLNDVWGYVDGNGNEYALVGLVNGVSIVDLSTPTQPQEIHFISGPLSIPRDLKTYQSYAYVSNETDSGLLIIDLSGLPGNIVYKDTIIGGVKTAHNLFVADDYLYVIGDNKTGGFEIFDLQSDPWNPAWVGNYDQEYAHDAYIRGGLAYTAEISAGFLKVVDVSFPSSPTVLGSINYPRAFTHNTWLNDSGNICFTADEIAGSYVQAWDVSDPTNIFFLDRIRSNIGQIKSTPHNVHVLNDYLITSHYADGVHIADAAWPKNLIEVGYYDTSPLESGNFEGAWGAYPFLPSGLILISDMEEGLFILQPNLQRGCYLEGVVTDQVTSAPIVNVKISILGSTIEELSRTAGDYAIGIADSGSYQVSFSKYGYISDTADVILDNGQMVFQDMVLEPLPTIPLTISILDKTTMQPVSGAIIQATVPQSEAIFEYTSNFNGLVVDNRFVINPYHIVAGKWGYVTSDTSITIDSTNANITFLLEPGYYDDFALDFDWDVSGSAERGVWEKGEPVGTYRGNGDIYNPEFDISDDIGDEAYVTGNAGGSPFWDDVDNGFTILVSPPLDLSNYVEPVLQYHWWFLNWSLNGPNPPKPGNDFLTVSVTDGVDTTELKRYIGPFDTIWNAEQAVYFSNDVDITREVKFIFYTQDLEPGNQDAVEAAIDGFRVIEKSALSIDTPISEEYRFTIYPNPVKEDLIILLETSNLSVNKNLSLEILNLQGKKLEEVFLLPYQDQFHLPFRYSRGIYLLIFKRDGVIIGSIKLIK